ncbi:MAG: hypothetical protein MK101_06775 [Phycisphaerales bacterium]|nr:hypothetical protein [Phycisphaerales bacterium]
MLASFWVCWLVVATAAGSDPNLTRLDHDVWTGPASIGVDTLHEAGVGTIVSVDALPPQQKGHPHIRRVHIPIVYTGISAEQANALLVAWRDCPRPLFIHCHHGKHRGPAAAVHLLQRLGRVSAEEAVALLERCGTSKAYPGLWRAVSTASPVPDKVLQGLKATLVPHRQVRSMAQAMARLDRAWTRIRQAAGNGWKASQTHPDLAPDADAAAVTDLLRAASTHVEVGGSDPLLAEAFRQQVEAALSLEEALAEGDLPQADHILLQMDAACGACHRAQRDGSRFVEQGTP